MQFVHLGTVSSIEVNHKPVDIACKGSEVCVKIEPTGGDAPKLFGRHFDYDDLLVSKVSVVSSSLNFCKNAISIISQKIFSRMIHVGNIKGVAWQYFHEF